MKNILVTNFQNSGEDVMIFTENQSVDSITKKLTDKKESFEEIYEVESDELQYYIYDPLWFD